MKTKAKRLLLCGVCAGFAGLLAAGSMRTSADEITLYTFPAVTDANAAVGSAEHPFRILEIVPNESMGMIGYMIDGCEPISMEALAGQEYGATQSYRDNMVTTGLVEQERIVSYAFESELPAEAEMAGWSGEFGKWWKNANSATDDTTGYSEFGYYENVGAGNGAYSYDTEGDTFSYVGIGNGEYSWNLAEYYVGVGTGNGAYIRMIDGTDLDTCTFAYVGDGAGNYACTVLLDTMEEDRTVADPETRYWTFRTQSEYYSRWYYEYTNNDCFLQAVFETTAKDGFVTEVVTITPDMLKGDNLQLIDAADLIVMTAQEEMTMVWDAYNLDGITRTEEEKAARPKTFLGADGNDLTWEATLRIVERMASDTPPGFYMQGPALHSGGNSGEYNVGKLYVMLMQYGANVFQNTFIEGNDNFTADTYVTSDGKTTYGGVYVKHNDATGQDERITNWDQQTFLTPYGESVMHEAYFPSGMTGEVFGTILLFNGDTSFLRGFLTTMISEVTSETSRPTWSNSEMFDYYEQQTGTRPTQLPMGNAVHYIIANALGTGEGNVARKEKLNILELQPCNKFIYGSEYWQLYYMSIFPWFQGNLTEDVTVTTMTTYQFIGDITDLNSEYDLIIIGSSQDATNGLDGYNDAQLGHLIYTSIGDIVTTYYNPDWNWSGKANGGKDEKKGSDAYQMKSRYSGTDITKKKYEELRDFMTSGYPIVADAKLYSDGTQVDTSRVDVNSYIYRLVNSVYQDGNGSLLFKAGVARNSSEQKCLKEALSQERLSLIFAEDGTGLPLEYSAVTKDCDVPVKDANGNTVSWTHVEDIIVSENYNTDTDDNGNPVLRYTFAVKGNDERTYGVRLYLDHNGDGVYNNSIKEKMELLAAGKEMSTLNTTLTSEEANGSRISIYDQTGQEFVSADNLLAGHTYQLIYRVRSTECGILPWKLEIYDQSNQSIRNSKTGYTAFRVNGNNVEKEQVNVLQMNLMPDMRNETTTFINFADETTATGAKFAAYLDAVEDFDVNLEFMKNRVWYDEFGEFGSKASGMGYTKEVQIARWKEFLEDYDMLIIGYCDMASFTNDEIFYEGFMEFVNQGKSVILSHDLVSDASFLYMHNNLTTEKDPAMRTLAGQRRKYYVGDTNYYRYSSTMLNGTEISLLPPDDFLIWFSGTGHGWERLGKEDFMSLVETNIPETDTTYLMDYGNEFMDNSVRLMMTYSKDMKRDRILNSSITNFSWLGHATTEYVEIANRGQITMYPYSLGDMMKVSTTHVQNYQLDLEQEDGGDVTVWYNLTDRYDSDVTSNGTNDGVYSSRSGDSRNNYYIYTKGNITYTGLGHKNATLTNDEVKLFVNTMVSSYRDVPAVPYARVENADASEHKGDYTLYVPLTGAESAEDTIEIDFSIADENDHNITSVRSYRLQYTDANGNVLSDTIETSTPNGSLLTYLPEEQKYEVQQNGTYTFKVPCETVLRDGEAVYYLNVTSSYYAGTKEYTTSKTTRVVVYAMPLFSLH